MTDGPTRRGGFRARICLTTALAVSVAAALAPSAGLAARQGLIGPYFSAPFKLTKLQQAFGHGASWDTNGQVLSTQFDRAGLEQIYRANRDGSHQRCLTCRTVPGPNGLPQERPQGDWVLFESYGEQPVHVGDPGLGGYGGDLYVMRPDGTHPYRLTTNSDPNHGAPYTPDSGVPYDNFHAYWSPDGGHVIWTHAEGYPLSQGGERWEMLLGDFTVTHGKPALDNVRVVGRPYGVYETQPWSPDGKGFLFCAAGGLRSPFQATPPGWGNMRLYYMRLYGKGASPAHPRVTLIGDNDPVYEEQALLTPDMRTVIMMSNRGDPLGSWYDLVAAAAQRTRFDAPDTGPTQTLQFLADFDGTDFHSDLYAVDVRTGAVRRLTNLHGVIPEFYWNHDYTRMIWGMGQVSTGTTYVASFTGLTAAQRRIPSTTPAALYGKPVDMARVGDQAQPIRDLGPTDNLARAVRPPVHPAAGFPHASRNSDTATIPAVTGTYVTPWLSDLKELGQEAGLTFTTDPLKRLGVG
jgi:hypothetical protein